MRSTLSSAGSRRCTTGNKDPPPRKLALVPCLHRDKVVPLDGATNPTPPPRRERGKREREGEGEGEGGEREGGKRGGRGGEREREEE